MTPSASLLVTLWHQPLWSAWPPGSAMSPLIQTCVLMLHAHCRNTLRARAFDGGPVESFHNAWITSVAYSRN